MRRHALSYERMRLISAAALCRCICCYAACAAAARPAPPDARLAMLDFSTRRLIDAAAMLPLFFFA